MYQCILNVPLWNNWSKVTYSQVHGSPVLKALLFQSLNWIPATMFAELMQFRQGPKFRRPRIFWREHLVFYWRKISDFIFIYFSASFAVISRLERLNGIQWLWIQIPLRPTFYSYFKQSSVVNTIYQFIPLHLWDYLMKISIK